MKRHLLMSIKDRQRPATAYLRKVESRGVLDGRMTIREVLQKLGLSYRRVAAAISGFVKRETRVLCTAAAAYIRIAL